jgi:hypothetical protein
MNERIRKLAEDANRRHFINEDGSLTPELHYFAELIVRECADIAKHHVMNISTYADADFVDEQIKHT